MSSGITAALLVLVSQGPRMAKRTLPAFSREFRELANRMRLTFVDIGARGGLDEALLPLSSGVNAVGFEPEPQEAARLRIVGNQQWREVRILPFAVGVENGEARLFVPPNAIGASLIPHNPSMLNRFGYDDLHGSGSVVNVSTVTLDELCKRGELRKADYLKIDIEGAELGVLRCGEQILRGCKAIKIECSFLEQRVDQPLVTEVATFMLTQGFDVIDVVDIHRWRRRPLPTHPYVAAFDVPYSRGQIAQCDLILLRRADTLEDPWEKTALTLIAACLGYFDFAISVIRDHPEVEQLVMSECGKSLERELSQLSRDTGRQVVLREIRRSLRNLIPLMRSLLGGLPVVTPRRPY